MANKIKNNLIYVFSAGLGLFNFILLAIPYVASFGKSSYGYSYSRGISGYKLMEMWNGGFGGVMSSIVQILVLLLGIALLAYGVCGLLKVFGVFKQFPDKLGKFEMKKLGEIGLFAYVALNALLFVFLIILCAANTDKGTDYSYGIRLSAGIFITLIISIGVLVALKVLQKKFPQGADDSPEVIYLCSECGKKARAKDKFCNDCGGKIVQKTENPKHDAAAAEADVSVVDREPT